MFVLVTDLPRTEADSERYRDCMTADGVIVIYRKGYVVEHASRIMKSGLGTDTAFLQTPSRESAMMASTVEFNRAECVLLVRGPAKVRRRFFEFTDALGINPRCLLGHT